jgi:hypothetical protein
LWRTVADALAPGGSTAGIAFITGTATRAER